jgi:hypothetical protein
MLRIGDPAGMVVGQRSERRIQRAHAIAPLRKFPDSDLHFRMRGRYQELRYFLLRVDGHHLYFDRREKSFFGFAIKRAR